MSEKTEQKRNKKIGQRFGRLIIVEFSHIDKHQKSNWYVMCDCGNKKIIQWQHMKRGSTQSCGCLHIEKHKTHGMTKTGTYSSWAGMMARCLTPSSGSYKWYGARGIQVCERWRVFENFLSDMGERPLGMTIERKDNNGNYEANNCIWIKQKEQASNTRKNVFLNHKGLRLTLSQWARKLGIPRNTIKSRRHRGLPVDKILKEFSCV
jgi:hypothetical protein